MAIQNFASPRIQNFAPAQPKTPLDREVLLKVLIATAQQRAGFPSSSLTTLHVLFNKSIEANRADLAAEVAERMFRTAQAQGIPLPPNLRPMIDALYLCEPPLLESEPTRNVRRGILLLYDKIGTDFKTYFPFAEGLQTSDPSQEAMRRLIKEMDLSAYEQYMLCLKIERKEDALYLLSIGRPRNEFPYPAQTLARVFAKQASPEERDALLRRMCRRDPQIYNILLRGY